MLPENDIKEPIPEFLSNGILLYFLYDHRFLYIQKRYEQPKKEWYHKITRSKDLSDDPDNYYVHKHKDIIKIEKDSKTIITKQDQNALVPNTNIWIGLLRHPITEGNLKLYYNGKYTTLKDSYMNFVNKYFIGIKFMQVTKTKNITNKEDVLVEKWLVYPDIPQNQSVFIL